jgi:hypothetical protein
VTSWNEGAMHQDEKVMMFYCDDSAFVPTGIQSCIKHPLSRHD